MSRKTWVDDMELDLRETDFEDVIDICLQRLLIIAF
jgi:hypothetical protein